MKTALAKMAIYVAALLLGLTVAPTLASTISFEGEVYDLLEDGVYHLLDGSYDRLYVRDSPQDKPTTVELVAGGVITHALTVWDTSSALVSGGTVLNLAAYDASNVSIVGGYISALWPCHDSTVDISGGYVEYAHAFGGSVNISDGQVNHFVSSNDTIVTVSGGVVSRLELYDRTAVEITGGFVRSLEPRGDTTVEIAEGDIDQVWAWDSSTTVFGGDFEHFSLGGAAHLSMSDGSIDYLVVNYTSTVDIFGGSVSKLYAERASVTTIHGYDFVATDGLILSGNEVLETGTLTGKWLDGTAWTMSIVDHWPEATISTTLAPEPATLGFLVLGGLVLLRQRKSRK